MAIYFINLLQNTCPLLAPLTLYLPSLTLYPTDLLSVPLFVPTAYITVFTAPSTPSLLSQILFLPIVSVLAPMHLTLLSLSAPLPNLCPHCHSSCPTNPQIAYHSPTLCPINTLSAPTVALFALPTLYLPHCPSICNPSIHHTVSLPPLSVFSNKVARL